MLGDGGWRSGLARSVADADGGERVDRGHEAYDQGGRLDPEKGLRRFADRRRVGEAEAAVVAVQGLLGAVGSVLPADQLGAVGRTQNGKRTARHVAAHQRGMGERLQEIERDRKQRHGQNRRAPALLGTSADHGLF